MKNIKIIVFLVVILSLSVCISLLIVNYGRASNPEVKLGKAAIDVIDHYLDFKISGIEAGSQLAELYKRSEAINCQGGIDTYIARIGEDILANRPYNVILEGRNTIAKYCGVRLRNK